MTERPTAYLSPKLEARYRPEIGGHGMFAIVPVEAGELLIVWSGEIFTAEDLVGLNPQQRRQCLQVEEDLYLVTMRPGEPADYVNHCCDPNAGLDGQIVLRAVRNIAPGEEICFDYATCDGSPYDEFDCACGAPNCRGRVTGDDWRDPALWERYAGQFSPYLQRRIDELKLAQRPANGRRPHPPEVRRQKIRSYAQAYEQLSRALAAFPRGMWPYRPAEGGWSIHENIVHLADSEANGFIRLRKLLAEPGQQAMGYDEAQWAWALNYAAQSADEALELFRWLRLTSTRVLEHAGEADWASTIEHPDSGLLTLDDWLDIYERHVGEHLSQMWATHARWLAAQGLAGEGTGAPPGTRANKEHGE